MLISDLEVCLHQVNPAGLDALDQSHSLIHDLGRSNEAARVYAASGSLNAGGGLLKDMKDTGFNGRTAGGHASRKELEALIHLSSHDTPPTHGRVGVGAVIDSLTQPSPRDDPQGRDLPVVLAVGINPGWQGQPPARRDFLAQPPSLYDDTGLRTRLESVAGLLRTKVGYRFEELAPGGSYHLVAASFFPWVTTAPWPAGATPVLAEELLLGYFGWPNPLDFIARLIQALWQNTVQPLNTKPARGLTHVVFHGADNAAARCGRALIGQMNENKEPLFKSTHPLRNPHQPGKEKLPSPDVIICDDLTVSGAGKPIENAVWLRRQYHGDDAEAVLDGEE